MRSVVAIEDTSFGGDEAPGVFADSAEDVPAHCAPESLETVGLVALEALDTIGRRLAKIDRFSRVPSNDLASGDTVASEAPPSDPGTETDAATEATP